MDAERKDQRAAVTSCVGAAPGRPLMIYDGDCGFCLRWIERWRRRTGPGVDYEPSQRAAERFPEIPAQDFERSVVLIEPDGRVSRGAEAVTRCLAHAPGWRWPLWIYRRVPGARPLGEACYRFVASHRSGLSRVEDRLVGRRGPTDAPGRSALALLYAFFFASGLSALIYQVAWVRILSVDFGTTVHAVSTVLTIFMAGLALGSWAFGRWVDRSRRPLLIYAGIEGGLALWALGFVLGTPWLHEVSTGLLQSATLSGAPTSLVKFGIALVVLLPPTTLMGGTLPVLARQVNRSADAIGLRLGSLYGLNTLGAVFGSLLVAFLFIPTLGIMDSILLAGAINVLLALGSVWLSRSVPAPPTPAADAPAKQSAVAAPASGAPDRMGLVYAIAFASGFITLATEVLWTRLFINLLSGNVLVFATILAAFLTGIALGSLVVARRVDRMARLDGPLALALGLGGLCLLASMLGQQPVAALLHRVASTGTTGSGPAPIYLALGTMFALLALPATVFGAVFPLLFRWGTRSLATIGRDVGRLYAFNTVGSIAGSFASGFLMIRFIGVNGSLLLLAAAYGALACGVGRRAPLRVGGALLALGCVVLFAMPSVRRPVHWLNGGFLGVVAIDEEDTLYIAEGVEGTVGVAQMGDARALTVNGVIVAESSRIDLWDLLLKAHLPMMLHEDPAKVALVGLGAGVSLGAVQAYDELERVDCIEIAAEVEPAHRYFGDVNGRCWEDPRLNLVRGDGRHHLLLTDERYDVISVDPTDPPVVYQYTQDFFQVCHDRLSPGGLMVQWVPMFRLSPLHLRMIFQAFARVFPESTVWYDGTSVLLIGSRDRRLEIDVERFLERAARPAVQESLAPIGAPPGWLLLGTYVSGPEGLAEMIGADVPDNTDDFPYLEYAVLLSGRLGKGNMADNLSMLQSVYEPMAGRLSTSSRLPGNLAAIDATRELMKDLLRVRLLLLAGKEEEAELLATSISRERKVSTADWELFEPFLF
jgi:spermidine synthase